MKKGLLCILFFLFAETIFPQSRTLLYTNDGWVQINFPTGQTPDNRPPTSIDDVIYSKSRSGQSSIDISFPQDTVFKIGGDTSSFCRRMYIIGMEVEFRSDPLNDYGGRVDVYAENGGFLSLDSGAVLQEGQVHVIGTNQGIAGVEVHDSKFGYRTTHNTDWAGLRLVDDARVRFINSSFEGIYLGREDSSGKYSSGGGITAIGSTFSASSFILGDNSVDTFLNSSINPRYNNHDLDFMIGKNSNFYSDNDSISVIYGRLYFKSSGSVFKGHISSWYINFDQEDQMNPLPNIIDGDVVLVEDPGCGISGDVKVSGNFIGYMPYVGFSDKGKVFVNNQQVFEIGGIRNFGTSTSISDCAQNFCHYKMEFFGNKNSNIDWNIGFPVDTLVINKTGCAKVTSKNPIYVAGETRIESGQLSLDPIDSIPYQLVCAGKVSISPGGGLFLRKDAKGNVANIAIGDTLIDNSTGTPDSTCAGLSNPYNGRIDFYRETTSTGNTDTTSTGNNDTVQIAHTDSLVNFVGSYFNKSVSLKWSMEKQSTTKSFSIEKSFDETAFFSVTNLIASPNTPVENDYSFTDNSSLKAINYYRLKVFDIHDNYYYSDTVAVAAPDERILFLYPNPAKDYVYLDLVNIQGEAEIKIVNINGAVVKKLKLNGGAGNLPINISQLQRGTYSIFIHSGQTDKTLRFIKD